MHSADDEPEVTPGAVAAMAMAVLVLAGVVLLFVILKFNLFQGGSSNDLRTSSPAQVRSAQPRTSVSARPAVRATAIDVL